MKEYTIIIADDEREIIEGILHKIDFQAYGFVVVAAAENGQDALELALKLQPDIVMSDIVMPFMDGLELGEHLAKELPSTKFIVFSGYDDLDYAHKAIKLDAVEYVLKPVNAQELTNVLLKLKNQLDNEYASRRNYENLLQHYRESLPIINEMFLCGLLEGKITEEEFQNQAALAGVAVDAKGYIVTLFEIEKDSQSELSQMIFKEKNSLLMTVALKQLITDTLNEHSSCSVFLYGKYIAAICNIRDEQRMEQLPFEINEVCQSAHRVYDVVLSAGISTLCKNRWNISYACKEAMMALDYQLVLGCGKAICYNDVEPDANVQLSFHGQDEQRIMTAIRIGNTEDLLIAINEVFEQLYKTLMPLEYYRIYIMELIVALLKLLQTYHLQQSIIFPKEFDIYNPLATIDSLEQFQDQLIKICQKIAQCIHHERIHTSTQIVTQVSEYMHENYANDSLTVDSIAKVFNISPSYLSTLFKKEKEESLIIYLTNIRLDVALHLLQTTDEKSYVIAEKVGYSDANYFSYVFKKKFGIAPTKYRNNRGVS